MFSPKTESRINTTKRVVRFAAVKSVSGAVVTVLHQNTETFNKLQKAQLYIGAYLVANMVADKAWDHLEAQIDDVIDVFRPKDEDTKFEDTDVDITVVEVPE